jgi:hypothetical protein
MKENWYVIRLKEELFEGPVSFLDLQERVAAQQTQAGDLVYSPGKTASWIRVHEVPELKISAPAASPAFPPISVLKHFRLLAFEQKTYAQLSLKIIESWFDSLPLKSGYPDADWHILKGGQERGPYHSNDLSESLKSVDNLDGVYVWRISMPRWKSIGVIPQFRKRVSDVTSSIHVDLDEDYKIEKGRNFRNNFRHSLPAYLNLVDKTGNRQMIGICGDISTGGFQLIPDLRPFDHPIGSLHRFEIKPIKLSGILPFQVDASICWIDPKKRMGMRIDQIEKMDLVLLQTYLKKRQ